MKETISKVNRQFSEREKILANKTTKNYLKRCSTSLIIREMQIKTTEVSSQAGQNGHRQKSTNNKCWRGCGKRELSYIVGGNANWFTLYGDQCGDSLKIWVQNCHMTQQSPCWAYIFVKFAKFSGICFQRSSKACIFSLTIIILAKGKI